HVVAKLAHSVWVGVIVSTVAFGLAHAYQGRRGVIGTTIFGLFFAGIMVLGSSLWPCMAGHVLQDLVGGALVYRRLGGTAEQATPDTSQSAAAPNAEQTS
ncbi:MAG: CPBP family intramembrane metalloprotease, partial [Candidatus Eremiobacteraeota bacterium]|nr:CPBP family intramembrane metalloprotease [Candidatus Eremiobacteraeota bacterium]